MDARGDVIVADLGSDRVRMTDTHGVISTIAGTGQPGYSGDGGPAAPAELNDPYGLALDAEGNLYISEFGRVRMVDRQDIIATVAGNGDLGASGDGGPAIDASIQPYGILVDAGNGVVRVVPSGQRLSGIENQRKGLPALEM